MPRNTLEIKVRLKPNRVLTEVEKLAEDIGRLKNLVRKADRTKAVRITKRIGDRLESWLEFAETQKPRAKRKK